MVLQHTHDIGSVCVLTACGQVRALMMAHAMAACPHASDWLQWSLSSGRWTGYVRAVWHP